MHEAAQLVRKEELMRYLLARYKLREIAKLMDVSYATLRKWANENDFLNELKQLSGAVWEDVSNELKKQTTNVQERLVEESESALEELILIMKDRTQKGLTRVKAAESILDRNPETSKTSKISGSVDHRHKIDPVLLMHAAATADELTDFKAKQLKGAQDEDRG